MPNPFRHRTNYGLLQAGKALQLPWADHAREETALFFLWQAYRVYLRELAHQLNLPDADYPAASAVQQALAGQGRTDQSLTELVALEDSGWAAALYRQWQACVFPQDSAPNTALIAAAPVAEPVPADRLLEAFRVLVERQRMVGEEW